MTPLSRPAFWSLAAMATGLIVLMMFLFFAGSSFGTKTKAYGSSATTTTRSLTVHCYSVATGINHGPDGFSVLGSYSGSDVPAWALHCANTRSQKTGWLAVLAVPTSVLVLLCLLRRPEAPFPGRPKQVTVSITPHVQ